MSARIAPEPIAMGTAVIGDYRPRANASARPVAVDRTPPQDIERKPLADDASAAETRLASTDAVAPEPALPPGAMFAAAVVAGALPPVPETPQQLLLRIGQSWLPPESELRLRDRSI